MRKFNSTINALYSQNKVCPAPTIPPPLHPTSLFLSIYLFYLFRLFPLFPFGKREERKRKKEKRKKMA